MDNKFYITTPIYYINSSPHIGHSYTNIAADTVARAMRLAGGRVYFLTGTDEHGQKIQKAASALGLTPLEFADKMVTQFEHLWKALNITQDDFIRTTQARHVSCVQKVLEILFKKGDIYESKYEGLYCVPCETFWLESQAADTLCPDCKRPVEKISETNYFFKLLKYQDWLVDYIEKNEYFIRPAIRRHEVLSFLKLNKLADLCISRPKERLSWGIPLPFSPGHVTYVWFDALINYISAVGKFDEDGKYHSQWWPAYLQLIGKDILRQHAVYWPIMLHALGLEPPKSIVAHGWWMVGESKMSKSLGNVVSPQDVADKFGVDVYRYFLLRDVSFGSDGNFSEEAITKRFNNDLANDLGNFVYRTLTMVEKYFQGEIPRAQLSKTGGGQEEMILEKIALLTGEVEARLSAAYDFNFSSALEAIWELINMADKYIEDTKPWNLAKGNKTQELKRFICLLVKVLKEVSERLMPFMPQTAQSIQEQLGISGQQADRDSSASVSREPTRIKKGNPLFPRLQV